MSGNEERRDYEAVAIKLPIDDTQVLGPGWRNLTPPQRQLCLAPAPHYVVRVFDGVPYLSEVVPPAAELWMLCFYLTPDCLRKPDLAGELGGDNEDDVRHPLCLTPIP